MPIYIALENLRSLHNIGAIFRTCSFFGVYNILLVGYSGKTKDHYDRVILHPDVAKTALGAEEDMNIEFIEDSAELIKHADKKRAHLVAVEQHENSTVLEDFTFLTGKDVILVFGNEVEGVSEEVLNAANVIVEIQQLGKKGSLNVTTACGITLATLLDQK